jgi:hypothetical protein
MDMCYAVYCWRVVRACISGDQLMQPKLKHIIIKHIIYAEQVAIVSKSNLLAITRKELFYSLFESECLLPVL